MGTGKALTVKEKVQNVQGLLERNRDTLMDVLPKTVDADRMVKVMFNSVRANPQLLDADPASLMSALINSATLGLEPNTPLGLAYLLPFRNNKKGITEIVFLVGYKGMVALAKRSGSIRDVSVPLIYENEDYHYTEGHEGAYIRHNPLPPSDRGKTIVAGYCRVVLPDGSRPDPVFVWKDEVDAIRERSRAKDSGPWKTDYSEMFKKTVIRKAFKLLDLDTSVNRAVALDEQYEAGLTPRDFRLSGEDLILDKPEIGTVEALPEGETAPEEAQEEKTTPPEGKDKGKDAKAGKKDETAPKQGKPPEEEKKEEPKGKEEPKKDGPSLEEETRISIREVCDALGKDDTDLLLMECKDLEDLKKLRAKLYKQYNEALSNGK